MRRIIAVVVLSMFCGCAATSSSPADASSRVTFSGYGVGSGAVAP